MRKVYIDDKLKTYCVPSEMRENSASEGKVFTPGTRIPLSEDVKVVRLFTAWSTASGKSGGIDIDLGGAFIRETAGQLTMEPIAYYNQSAGYAVHSGDFTSCKAFDPKGTKFANKLEEFEKFLEDKGLNINQLS